MAVETWARIPAATHHFFFHSLFRNSRADDARAWLICCRAASSSVLNWATQHGLAKGLAASCDAFSIQFHLWPILRTVFSFLCVFSFCFPVPRDASTQLAVVARRRRSGPCLQAAATMRGTEYSSTPTRARLIYERAREFDAAT